MIPSLTLFSPRDFQVWMWTSSPQQLLVHYLLFCCCSRRWATSLLYLLRPRHGLPPKLRFQHPNSCRRWCWTLVVRCLCSEFLWPRVSLSSCFFIFLGAPSLFSSPSVLVETVQNNPALLVESNLLVALQNQDNFMETSIPVPTLNWQDVSNKNSGFAECV